MRVPVIVSFDTPTRTGTAPSAAAVRAACRIAAERGLMVDLHCDESDDPLSRHIETLAAETVAFGLQGRVTGSHLTSMHSMDNYYVSKLIPLMVEAQMNVIPNPLINIMLQGRHDTYPKRRGMTRVPLVYLIGAGRLDAARLRDIASFGGWSKVQAEHFADGGIFDQIYVPK